MDLHEFTAHDGLFAADEFADDAEGFGTMDDLDLPFPVRRAGAEGEGLETDPADDVA